MKKRNHKQLNYNAQKQDSLLHELAEKHLEVIQIVVVQDLLQLAHLVLHVVEAFYFCRVHVQICNYAPKVRQLSWLLLVHFLDAACVGQDGLVVLAEEVVILLVVHLQLLQAVNKLVLTCDVVLFLHLRVQSLKNVEHRLVIEVRVDYQLQAPLVRLRCQLVLHYGQD